MSNAAFDSVLPREGGNTASGKYFTGQDYLSMLDTEGIMMVNVILEPGCRNNWHVHHASKDGRQTLLCTTGSGWFQAEGETPVSLGPGSVVTIPANCKHWHGAREDSWLNRIAIEVSGEGTSNEWRGLVPDEYYEDL